MKLKYIIGILVIGTLLFFLITRTRTPELPPLSGTNVIAFGDSLVYGSGSTEGNDFVSVLSSRTEVPIINAGIPGNTTEDALKRLSRDVLTQDPKVVIVVIGGNDFLRRVPKAQTLTNLRSIISQIKASGARVVLVGTSRLTYNGDFKGIAQDEGVLFVPHVMDGLLGKNELMADAIHPNDAGYQLFADAVEPYLEKALKP